MKPILGREGRAALAGCRERGALLAFDFDGTLAPIVADPALAALRPSTRRLLARLARRSTCVVLSGRAVDDVAARLAGVGIAHVVGNHGAAFALSPAQRASARARVLRWRAELERRLDGRPGLALEDNGVSLAV
ncbi:MAG TPA: trehalose-phosphatase, partial [Planctomycetota bacterium]|nr:trehalose-phosphatase [Planctomycetota bacterium]